MFTPAFPWISDLTRGFIVIVVNLFWNVLPPPTAVKPVVGRHVYHVTDHCTHGEFRVISPSSYNGDANFNRLHCGQFHMDYFFTRKYSYENCKQWILCITYSAPKMLIGSKNCTKLQGNPSNILRYFSLTFPSIERDGSCSFLCIHKLIVV